MITLELPGIPVAVGAPVVETWTLFRRYTRPVAVLDRVWGARTSGVTTLIALFATARVEGIVVCAGALTLCTVRPLLAFRAILHACAVVLRAIPVAAMTHAFVAAVLPHVTTLEAVPPEEAWTLSFRDAGPDFVVAHLSFRACATVDAFLVAVVTLGDEIATGSAAVTSAFEILKTGSAFDA